MENLLIERIGTKALFSISFLPNGSQNDSIATFVRNLSPASMRFQVLAIAKPNFLQILPLAAHSDFSAIKFWVGTDQIALQPFHTCSNSARIGQDLDCCLTRNIKATKTNSTHNSQICLVSDRRC